jgi:lipopolysaccharide export system protein LptA
VAHHRAVTPARRRALFVVAALGAALGASAAAARPPARGAPETDPLDLSADRLDLDVAARTAVASGHVRVKKGAVTVTCPRVDVRYDDGPNVTWARGSGGVVALVEGVRAEAPEVELDVAKQVLELRGGVRLARGGGWIAADRVSIEVATGKVSMSEVKGSIPAGQPLASALAPLAPPSTASADAAAP